jgi:hypothetical protein
MKVIVTTTLSQELTVPEGTTKEEILDWLGEHQSFRTAFQGVSADGITIEDLGVIDEEVVWDEEEDDGQPTEHDEWMSFDPDC